MKEQKIKQDGIQIGKNIKKLRLEKRLKPHVIVKKVQLLGVNITRESLGKIERGEQHIFAEQLWAIREALGVTYDDLLKKESISNFAGNIENNL